MTRLVRALVTTAAVLGGIAAAALPLSWIVAVVAVVLAVMVTTCSVFAWFRLDDLRERLRNSHP